MNSLIDCLDHWSKSFPQRYLYTFLNVHGQETDSCTYGDFQRQTNFLASALDDLTGLQSGRPVLLSYPPGLEMIKAFIACVKLGVIPVPIPPISRSSLKKDVARLNAIIVDSGASTLLTVQKHKCVFQDHLLKNNTDPGQSDQAPVNTLDLIATDKIPGELASFNTREQDLLFLQYTSGSTRAPRGVMVSHKNVLHNCPDLQNERPVGVCWLPHYHDMGLIGYYLFAIVTGGSSHCFSAMDFMRKPALWLETITKVKATNTSAPNFAFEYCLRKDKLPDSLLQGIDLSSLRNMMNASEPVDPATIQRFRQRFEPCGLSHKAFNVAYGLAEHTLRVSAGGNIHLNVNKDRLARLQPFIISGQQNLANAVQLPSAGKPLAGVEVRIVDPESLLEKAEASPGEIWVDSASKALGYWRQAELSKQVFQARLSGADTTTEYLRTGDIGFFHEGELYICGRNDDMVVIRGRNIFPPDIEATVESHFPELEQGRVAVFGVNKWQTGDAQLVVLIESRSLAHAPNLKSVHREIVNSHQVPVMAVAVLRRGSITRTTSGKIARHQCQLAFVQDQLEYLDIYRPADIIEAEKTIEDYLDTLMQRVADKHGESITIAELGLDSLELVELGILLENLATREKLPDRNYSSLIYDLRLLQAATIGELKNLCKRIRSGHVPMDKIARRLEDEMQAIVNNEAQQMRQDMSLSSSCIPVPYSSSPSNRTILLTGATGFLGSFLLEALLRLCDDPIVVLVRGQDHEHAKLRLVTALTKTGMPSSRVAEAMRIRIQTLRGDISQSNLDLSKDQWNSLSKQITTVYHCAAEVDYIKTYRELRASNVTGTEEVIRLCCTGLGKELNFISATFIFGWKVDGLKDENSRNAQMKGLDFGYPQSKWVAEQLVFEAAKRGLKTRIFRPALITASESGHYIRGDISTRVLGYMIRHQLSINSENQLSFLPVEICANNIIAIALLDDFRHTTFHLTAGAYYSIATVSRTINKLFGYQFSYVDMAGFVDHMNQHCTPDDDLFPLLAFFNNSREKFRSMSHTRYDNAYYKAYCDRSEFAKPEPDLEKTMSWIVSFLTSTGLVEAPPGSPGHTGIV